jgi:hypothetical protein
MSLRALALAAVLGLGALLPPLAPAPALAQSEPAAALSLEQLLHATSLDEVFTQFGPGIAAAPEEQAIPFVGAQRHAWEQSALEVFDAARMNAAVARLLDGKFEPEEMAAFGAFFGSPFGQTITATERAINLLSPAEQDAVRELGMNLAAAGSPARQAQVTEMLKLVSADISTAIVRQSVRGMLIGMSMSGQRGDIEVPWEEIDAQLDGIMAAVEVEVLQTQRALVFYAYRELSDAQIEQYLEFLRTAAAQKLYAIAAYAIGETIAERMQRFGETFARRLAQVSV